MITPNDIATKDFKKVAVGYSPEEVDTFLDDIYEDYEKLYKESQKEKSKTEAVAEDTDRLKHLEKSIERTLSLAEAAAEETKAAAKADGDAIINSAKQQRIFWHPQEQRRMSWNRRFPDWKAVTN